MAENDNSNRPIKASPTSKPETNIYTNNVRRDINSNANNRVAFKDNRSNFSKPSPQSKKGK